MNLPNCLSEAEMSHFTFKDIPTTNSDAQRIHFPNNAVRSYVSLEKLNHKNCKAPHGRYPKEAYAIAHSIIFREKTSYGTEPLRRWKRIP